MILPETTLQQKLLPYVERPAQYAGNEYNCTLKNWDDAPARMAFAFPDSYEIGMSYLGMRLLYETVNRHTAHLMERVFMPLPDMAALLRKHGLPLTTLESRHELKDFDVVGFTLQYELSYTNILAMLDLAGIPLLAAERDESMPLIIAGGPCAYNPEPLCDVIDLFQIGEGEEMMPEMLDLVAKAKQEGWSRTRFLEEAVKIPGIYVPRFYKADYNEKNVFAGLSPAEDAPAHTPLSVRKRILQDMDAAPFPDKPILPNVKPVHDRVVLEVMRGCTHGCRFCQAGIIYRPLREKQPALLREQARVQVGCSGYDDISLLSLSTADYTAVEQLMDTLTEDHAAKGVGISLPSLRVDAFSVGLAARTQEVRKTGITLAPEAGSPRMRDVINKGVTEQDILTAAGAAFSQGYTHIKLYFMLGLPYETDSDIIAIAELCRKILQLGKRNKPADVKKPLRLSLGVSSFVPKCNSPFQWQGQDSLAELQRKQELLREHIKPLRQVSLHCHDRETSLLEAAFARGDRRLSPVLVDAYRRGCFMDGWMEHFKPDTWREAFAAHGLTPEMFAEREIIYGEALPWAHIDSRVSEAWLWKENMRAARAELTADCRGGSCSGCGVCGPDAKNVILPKPEKNRLPQRGKTLYTSDGAFKYRCKLAISENLAWFSHLDLLGVMEKALRRSGLPIAYSQGFNPHMLISWGPAHPVGLVSEAEYVDLLFGEHLAEGWQEQLQQALPDGMRLLEAREVPFAEPALMAVLNAASYRIALNEEVDAEQLDAAVEAFLAAQSVTIERVSPKGKKTAEIRPAVQNLYREGDALLVEMRLDKGAAVRMPELMRVLLPQLDTVLPYVRTGLWVAAPEGNLPPWPQQEEAEAE